MHPVTGFKTQIAAVFLISVSIPTWANTQLGHGLTKCNQFNVIQMQVPELTHAFEAWITGYLSGMNFVTYAAKGVDFLSKESAVKATSFVKGYCSANPDRTVTEGANEYWFGLTNRVQR